MFGERRNRHHNTIAPDDEFAQADGSGNQRLNPLLQISEQSGSASACFIDEAE